jgi:hypothetical protein
MKKNLLFLSLVMTFSVIIAQDKPRTPNLGNYTPSSRDNEYVCMPDAVYSQVYPSLENLYYCQNDYTWYMAADDYSASAPFSTLRIWGGDFYSCSLAPTESFDIKIWDDAPWDSGNLIYSQTISGTTTFIGVNIGATDIYQVDFDLGTTITQLTGWIGVTRNNASCSEGFAWAFGNWYSGNSVIFDGSWYAGESDMMMCLGNTTPTEVPVSNWALFIGLGLILAFAVIRFRRVL